MRGAIFKNREVGGCTIIIGKRVRGTDGGYEIWYPFHSGKKRLPGNVFVINLLKGIGYDPYTDIFCSDEQSEIFCLRPPVPSK